MTRRVFVVIGSLLLALALLKTISAAPGDTGGPDGFGYIYIDSNELGGPVYDWVDISGTGSPVALGDDDVSAALPIGFWFNFYGNDVTEFYIQSNGFIAFEEPTLLYYSNSCPLSVSSPDSVVALMWDDLDPADAGSLAYYETFSAGSCPYNSYSGACMVAEYEDFEHYPGEDGNIAGTFEAILFDDDSIILQYEDVGDEEGSGSTTGIGNSDGSINLTYGACNTAGHLEAGLAILFRADPPTISVDPTVLSTVQDPDTTEVVSLTISNTGGALLEWEILEELAANQLTSDPDAVPQKLGLANPVANIQNFHSPLSEAVMDGGFEDGSPNAYWDEYSYNYVSPLCTVAGCGTGGGTGPYAGEWWAWFGGIDVYEEGYVSQTLTIPSSAAEMTFYVEQYVCDGGADYLELLVDGVQEFVTYGDDPACGFLGYRQEVVDISAYADEAEHTVIFHSEIFAEGEGGSNFFVDNVSIYIPEAGDCIPEAITWASASPSSGATEPDASEMVEVTFDSTGMAVGVYTGTLCVLSNDPAAPELPVDLTMLVVDPSNGSTGVSLSSFGGSTAGSLLPLVILAAVTAAAAGSLLLRRRRNDIG